jgi:Cellulase (glycosyl hydrolase family 5)
MMRESGLVLFLLLVLFVTTSCGGGGSASNPPDDPPAVVAINITAPSANVVIGGTLQFTAHVTGTTNTAVTWSVDDKVGGDATSGTITSGGLYTAPAVMPSLRSVKVMAGAQADTSKASSLTLTITSNVAVSVSPPTATVDLGGTQQFTATVTGTTSAAVVWAVNGTAGGDGTHGTITSGGLYMAPGVTPSPNTVTITAQSQVDNEKTGSATVTISTQSVVTIDVYPQNPTIPTNGTAQFVTVVNGLDNRATGNWAVNGVIGGGPGTLGTITEGGLYTAPATVPNPATAIISATSAVDSKYKGSTIVTITDFSVSVAPNPVTLAAKQQQQFSATVTNISNKDVDWQVNGITGGNATFGTISDTGLYTAPNSSAEVTISAVARAERTRSGSAAVSVLAPHRIGIRSVQNGLAEFYNRSTGAVFVPRGNNYIRLAPQNYPDGSVQIYHTVLNVGMYDPDRTARAFADMQNSGYNVVHVFMNGCCRDNTLGNPAGGLSSAYLDNVADFIQRAADHNLYVILSLDWVPAFGGYTDHYGGCAGFGVWNVLDLCSGGVDATTSFWSDFARALVQKKARLDNLLAYQVREEYFFESDQPPLSRTSGTVTTASGLTYDMGDPVSRQKMMDDGLVFWTNKTTDAIKAVDPTALVTVGFFVPNGPNPTRYNDPRIIKPYPAMADSNADFVSLSVYPFLGDITLPQILENFGFAGHQQGKPVIIGEYGALESSYPTETLAVTAMHDTQVQTCASGIKGWVFWTWDTPEIEQPPEKFWPAFLGDGLINNALGPAQRPDPCQ